MSGAAAGAARADARSGAPVLDLRPRGRRLGLKGPGAGAWLETHGLPIPPVPNGWLLAAAGDAGVLVARLGSSEYFLEQGGEGAQLAALERELTAAPPGVYPVLREDRVVELVGAGVYAALAEVSGIDYARREDAARTVVMTLMAGIAVLVIIYGTTE